MGRILGKVKDEDFVKLWCQAHNDGKSVADCVRDLGVGYNTAYNTARRLMTEGVRLPLLEGQRRSESRRVKHLNALIRQIVSKAD